MQANAYADGLGTSRNTGHSEIDHRALYVQWQQGDLACVIRCPVRQAWADHVGISYGLYFVHLVAIYDGVK